MTSKFRPASLNEVKAVMPRMPVIVAPFQPRAGLYLINAPRVDEKAFIKQFKANALQAGFLFEHVTSFDCYGDRTIEIRLRVRKDAAQVGDAQFAGRACVRRPTNFDFAPKPKRLAHMRHFIEAGEFTRADFKGSESAFVNRLFDEGMLEKNPDDLTQMRPTPEGVQWYMAHTRR